MRTTITINYKILRALKMRAIEADTNVSHLVEEAVKYQLLEDTEDIKDATKRKNEPSYAFDDLVSQLKVEGLL